MILAWWDCVGLGQSPRRCARVVSQLSVRIPEALLMLEAGFSPDVVVASVKRNSRVLGIARYTPPSSLAILDD